MAITLGSNIASLRAQRRLFENTEKIGTVFERLATVTHAPYLASAKL